MCSSCPKVGYCYPNDDFYREYHGWKYGCAYSKCEKKYCYECTNDKKDLDYGWSEYFFCGGRNGLCHKKYHSYVSHYVTLQC